MLAPWEVLTWRGRLLFLLGLVVGALAYGFGQRDLLWFALVLILLPVAALVMVARGRIRLKVRREIRPAQAPVGSALTGALHIDKPGRTLLGGVLMFDEAVPDELGSDARFTIHQFEGHRHRDLEYPLRGYRRGRFRVGPLRVEIRDPFGLARLWRTQTTSNEVLVTPQIATIASTRWLGAGGNAGEAAPRKVGLTGNDDVLVREYRTGDSIRRVHWRSTAHAGELMVRREEQAWDPSAVLILDSRIGVQAGQGNASSFEWAVSSVASAALHLIRRGFRVDIVDADGGLCVARASHEHALAEQDVLEALTDVQPTPHSTLMAAANAAQASIHGGQLVVAVLADLSGADAQVLLPTKSLHGRGLAMVLQSRTFGQRQGRGSDLAGVDALREANWTVSMVRAGTTVGEAWAELDQVAVTA